MKIQNLKTKVIGPILLLIPMTCMGLSDDHHSGPHHSSLYPQSIQSPAHDHQSDGWTGQVGITIQRDSGDET